MTSTKSESKRRQVTQLLREYRAFHTPFGGTMPTTRKQLDYLKSLINDPVEDGMQKFEEMIGKGFSELTREEASEWIGRLSGTAA